MPLLLGVNVSPLRALVQGAGHAWRVDAATFARDRKPSGNARRPQSLSICLPGATHADGDLHAISPGRSAPGALAADDTRSRAFQPVPRHARIPGVHARCAARGRDQRGERAAAAQSHPLQPWRPCRSWMFADSSAQPAPATPSTRKSTRAFSARRAREHGSHAGREPARSQLAAQIADRHLLLNYAPRHVG